MSQEKKANKNERTWSRKRDGTKDIMCFEIPPTPHSLLCSCIQKPWGQQSHTAKIMPRQHSVTALEVPLKERELFRWPGSNTFIWTILCTTHMHTYIHTCDVCHWFYSGFISLLSSWTGLSICQQQSPLSKSIKLSCQTNSAFLSSFPFGRMAGSTLLSQFLSSVAHLKWATKLHK